MEAMSHDSRNTNAVTGITGANAAGSAADLCRGGGARSADSEYPYVVAAVFHRF